jgi:hypothetical protein
LANFWLSDGREPNCFHTSRHGSHPGPETHSRTTDEQPTADHAANTRDGPTAHELMS